MAEKRLKHRASRRRGAALLATLFVSSVITMVVITMLQTTTLQYASIRNTLAFDRARYLAESAASHALAELEEDISWRDGISSIEFPPGSGDTYQAEVANGTGGTIVITGTGTAGPYTRKVVVTVKQGG